MFDPNTQVDPEHEPHPVVRPRVYVTVWLILLAFTGITTAVSFVDLGTYNAVVALVIAVIKASLVVLFFMHIHYSNRLLKLTVGAGLFTLMLLLGLTMSDYISRAWGMW